jgi:hypothetical protein
MYAQLPCLKEILKRNDIHPKFHDEFRALVEDGIRPGKELRTRLDCVTNYKAALDEALVELSKGLDDQFPPSAFESLDFESLDLEEFTQ